MADLMSSTIFASRFSIILLPFCVFGFLKKFINSQVSSSVIKPKPIAPRSRQPDFRREERQAQKRRDLLSAYDAEEEQQQ